MSHVFPELTRCREALLARLQSRLFAGKLLEAANNHIAGKRVAFDQPCYSPGLLGGNQRRTPPTEWVEHNVPSARAVPDSIRHKGYRFYHRLHARLLVRLRRCGVY